MVIKQYQLRVLIAVAEHGSLRAAADALHVTQPAITKAMRDLEADVGLPLLVRGARGVTLTPEGKVLLGRARMVARELERAEEDMRQLKGQADGRLAIGVTPLAGLTVMPEAFRRFRAVWPAMHLQFIELGADQIADALQDGTLDLAVGAMPQSGRMPPRGCEELVSLPTSLAIRRGSAHAGATSLQQLQALEWLHTDAGERLPMLIRGLYAARGLAPPARITRCTSQSLFYTLATQNDMVIIWSRHALEIPLLADQLAALPVAEALPELKLYVMQPEDGLLTRAAEYFIRCVKEVAEAAVTTG